MAMVRLTGKEHVILRLLSNFRTEMYGLQIVQESDGDVGRGSVYVLLDRMEQKGLVTSRVENAPDRSGIPRRLYRVTGHGASVLRQWERLQKLGRGAPAYA